MLPVHAFVVRRAATSLARSALPGAPVVATLETAAAARPRRALAAILFALADRV